MGKYELQNSVDLSQLNTTGIRIIILFSLLLESPKSADEINDIFFEHPLIRARFSDDTIRNDINTLRNCGCKISRALKVNSNKYVLTEHPFEFNLDYALVESLNRFYNKIFANLNFNQLFELEALFNKLSSYTKDNEIKEKLNNISALKNINKKILKELLSHCFRKSEITILYKSLTDSCHKEITIVADKVAFRHDKLYIFAYDTAYKKNGFYKVQNVVDIVNVKLVPTAKINEPIYAVYKILNTSVDSYIPQKNEKIIKIENNEIIIRAEFLNEFILVQNILQMGKSCMVLEPLWLKEKIIENIKSIRKVYSDEN